MFRRLASLAFLLLALQTALATAYPLVVRDDLGRSVRLEHAPRRIVAMIPSHTETVCALGACDLLVGVDGFSDWPAEVASLPHLGSAFDPDLEALVALEPDLVLTDEYSALADSLRHLGIPVYAGTPQTYEETLAFFTTLGHMLDRASAAAVVRGRVEGEVRAVREMTAGLPRPSVFVEIDPTPYSVGPGSFLGTLLAMAGGDTIVPASMGDYPQLDPEFVIAQDPEVVLLADAPYGQSVAAATARPGWSGLRATREGRVVALDTTEVDVLSRAGPRMGEAVRLLARVLHPGRF